VTCEICDEQTATMWVQPTSPDSVAFPPSEKSWVSKGLVPPVPKPQPLPSCDDCGPQLGYKILAPLDTIPNVLNVT